MDATKPTPIIARFALAVAAVMMAIAALWLVFAAALPYFYAESGSSRYARAHLGDEIAQIAGACLLFWIAWYCIRRSLSGRT